MLLEAQLGSDPLADFCLVARFRALPCSAWARAMEHRKVTFVWHCEGVERILSERDASCVKPGTADSNFPLPARSLKSIRRKACLAKAAASPAAANAYICHPESCSESVACIRRAFLQNPGICASCVETRRLSIVLGLNWGNRAECGCIYSDAYVAGCSMRTIVKALMEG